jgi:hypothetical protein
MRKFNPQWLNKPRKYNNPEARLLLSILKYLHLSGWYCGKVKVKGSFLKQGNFIMDRYLMKGLPDAFAFNKNGVMLAIETKVHPNNLTPEQEKFKEHFHYPPERLYFTIYSLEELEKIIINLDKS